MNALPSAPTEGPRPPPKSRWRTLLIAGDGKVRTVWAVAAFMAALLGAGAAIRWILQLLGLSPGHLGEVPIADYRIAAAQIGRVASVVVATLVGSAVVRGRFRDAGFVHPRPGRQFLLGVASGAALLTASVSIALVSGHERTSGPDLSPPVLETGALLLLTFTAVGVAEEMAMRGFFLQQLRRGLGRFGPRAADAGAVFLTGAVFGWGHLGNPNVSWLAVAIITLGGWVLGALVLRTGSLWLPIGLHTSWNLTQGYLWGEPVSGVAAGASVMHRTWSDGSIWTGGDFGPEATVELAVLLGLWLAALVLWRPRNAQRCAPGPRSSFASTPTWSDG